MFEVKVTVEIPGLPEAINNLADALKGQHNPAAPAQHITDAPEHGKTNTDVKADAPAAADPTATAPAQQNTVAPSAAAPSEKAYSLDDLSRAGAALIDAGKMPQLLDLLSRYGVQAVTQLDPSAYTAFVEDMKALGAQL